MNDRFKFRVWVEENHEDSFSGDTIEKGYIKQYKYGIWFNLPPSGDEIMWGCEDGVNEPLPICDKIILEQCTGLKDKNGNLIYEGDIIKSGRDIGAVKYGKPEDMTINCGEYDVDYLGYYLDIPRRDLEARCYFEYWEVIGNIHENGDLLD